MELKGYQQQVIKDLETYLEYIQQYKRIDIAYNKFWEDKIGFYNPITQEGMRSYQNNIPQAAHICIKVPTAGGKTFIACNALKTIFNAFPIEKPKAVIWLVPWSNLLDQTVKNLSNPDHEYRKKLNSLFNHRVEVYEKKSLLQGSNFNPTVVTEQLTIIVMNFASLRAKNKDDRKVYQENGQLAQFATQYKDQSHILEDTDETALINVIRSLNPVLVVDESHNAESELSVDMLKALNPSFILDLTATPRSNSNIISFVPAMELKKEHMVKLPVIVYNHHDKTEVINNALHLQRKLENNAIQQEKAGGRYIRPIILFQAQSKTDEENTTFEKLKAQLLQLGIPEEQIKIKTANKDEIKGIDLMSKTCPVRYIITINALKEGWDCPFAYILASLADRSSAVDVEQILGRVLRQPYVMKHTGTMLNLSYVLTASAKFNETLQNIVKGLQSSGFSDKDYRHKDLMPEQQKETVKQETLDNFFFPEQKIELPTTDDIDLKRIAFDPGAPLDQPVNDVIIEIEVLANQQNKAMEEQIKYEKATASENAYIEMGDKVKRYKMRDSVAERAKKIKLPQFFLEVPKSDIFETGTGLAILNQESLLKDFRLADEDTKINFDSISSDLYKIDLQETRKDEFTPSFTKIEDLGIKEPMVDYILAKPKENQVKDITHQFMQLIGEMYPIPEQDIKIYVERLLQKLNIEQLADFLQHKYSYKDKIKLKIKALADAYAETKFIDWLKIGKIKAQYNWQFSEILVPGIEGSAIGNSLYEKEGSMNGFEERAILELSSLPNITFWHRNLGKGKGFAINGFKSNHYPDFILLTNSNKVIVLETKGDDRDNSDSEAKCRLGIQWERAAGEGYFYFMVFDIKSIEGAHTLEKAKTLIRQL